MGYIYFSADKTYYSVPYRYIGCHTQVHYTARCVEVYKHQRIALHERLRGKGAYITNKEHLSSTHKAYNDWSPEYFAEKGSKVGINVELFIRELFLQGDYPEINYKRANGILQLARTYGNQRVDKACLKAVYHDVYSYQVIKNILQNNMDQHDLEPDQGKQSHIPFHNNIRGSENYQ